MSMQPVSFLSYILINLRVYDTYRFVSLSEYFISFRLRKIFQKLLVPLYQTKLLAYKGLSGCLYFNR